MKLLKELLNKLRGPNVMQRYVVLFVLFVVMAVLFMLLDYSLVFEYKMSSEQQTTASLHQFKTLLEGKYKRDKPKILLWSTFFGRMSWYEESKAVFTDVCNTGCTLTANKDDIETADAVVFHLNDITWGGGVRNFFGYPFPSYRRPDQVWVLYNMEPITMVWGSFTGLQGLFNWTCSFPRDSDVLLPYGHVRALTSEEITNITSPQNVRSFLNYDYFGDKNMTAGITMISDCFDDARRYRIIDTLRKYISIDVYGGCGKPCPGDYLSCNNLLNPYKFYFALENSDCRDYVTEKYWRSLIRKQIPIVAWKLSMDDLVIPNSYINVYDFDDLDAAGAYIKKVSENRTLYNSYFSWKGSYKMNPKNGFCDLCEKLKDPGVSSQVYHDMDGWLTSSVCLQASVSILFL